MKLGCSVVGALDWGRAMAAVAVDGGQWRRRSSGEESSSGKGKCGGKEVRQRVNQVTEWSWSAY
jgi:hypothetical protein